MPHQRDWTTLLPPSGKYKPTPVFSEILSLPAWL